jgi:serine protease Do
MSLYDKVRTQKILSFSLILFTLAIGVLIGTVVQTGAKAAKGQAVAADATPLTIPSPVQMQNEFSKIAKRLEPSVVNISTEYIPKAETTQNRPAPNFRRRQQTPQPQDQDQPDDESGGLQQFMQRFFGGGGGGGGFQFPDPQQEGRSQATGSGVVVDKNGYILTNNHVVEKATRIKVKFTGDATEYPAQVIGVDKETDLAVIHIDRKNLPAAKIGNSDALQVGDWAMAIGSPFGFQATVTAGIVSALSRDIGDGSATTFQHFIQTDAAINPGNSGGPLLNINGEVVGINTMIASRSGGYQGIGFAMPINTAVKVYNDIIQEGHVTRGSIGITFDAREDISDLLKVYGAKHGLFVTSIEPDGPAEKAGLKPQDVITEINGKPMQKGQDLIDIVADSPIGTPVKVSIVRDKKPITLTVSVGDRNKVFANRFSNKSPVEKNDSAPENAQSVRFGMSVQPLRPADVQRLEYKGNGSVMIASVEPSSFAEDIGLTKGDIIVEMNRQLVNSPEDMKKLQGTLKPGDSVAFHVMRQAGSARGTGGDWQSVFLAGRVPEGNQ